MLNYFQCQKYLNFNNIQKLNWINFLILFLFRLVFGSRDLVVIEFISWSTMSYVCWYIITNWTYSCIWFEYNFNTSTMVQWNIKLIIFAFIIIHFIELIFVYKVCAAPSVVYVVAILCFSFIFFIFYIFYPYFFVGLLTPFNIEQTFIHPSN